MAFYLGNFTGGLFNGAQTVLGLYSAYQGIMQTERDVSAADKAKQAREEQDALDKAKQSTGQIAAPTIAQPPADQTQTTPPPTLDRHDENQPKPDAKPVNVPKVKAVTGPTEGGPETTDPYRPSITTGLPKPLYPPAPFNAAGVAGAPGTPSGPVVAPPSGLPSAGPPIVSPDQLARERGGYDYSPPRLPVIATPQAAPAQGVPTAPTSVSPTNMPTQDIPYTQPGALSSGQGTAAGTTVQTPPAPPSVTVPPAGYLTGGPGQGAVSTGTGRPPVIPPPQVAPAPGGITPPSPTAPSAGGPVSTGAPTPLASAAPAPAPGASVGDTLMAALHHLSPFGTAQAAEQPPPGAKASDAAPNAPAEQLRIAQEQAKASNAPVKMADGRTVNPNGTVDNPPAQGITPAEPPKTDTPPAPQTPPVQVEDGKKGKVTADQPAPSVQSSSTPPVLAPPVTPAYLQHFQKNNTPLYDMIMEVSKSTGGIVPPEQLAAIVYRESRGDPNADASKHEGMGHGQGLMQIEPDTQATLLKLMPNLGHTFNAYNAKDNLIMGAEYLKYLAVTKNFGVNTVQQNLAYMRGENSPAAVKAAGGWDKYAVANPIAGKGIAMMYSTSQKIDDSMFTGGGQGATAREIVNAGHQDGPDGVLDLISRTGPAGMGMTDRWRSAQAALEYAAIAGGHMDRLPMIQDWISQQSHQGTLSNLMVAYNGLLTGNAQGASDALARAHAFFPDGTYARFGPDRSGHIWAQQFSDATGHEMGKPFQITPEALMGQIVALQNPSTFLKTLTEMQNKTADTDLKHAHAAYFRVKPALDFQAHEDAIEQRRQAHEDTVETRRSIADQTDATRRAAIERQRQADELHAETAAGNNQRAEAPVDKHITDLYGTDADPAHKAAPPVQAELHRAFMYPPRSGGAGLTTKSAEEYATGLIGDKPKYALKPGVGADGKPGYAITDADGKNPHATISQEQGDRLLAHPGVNRIAGAQRIAQPPGPQQHTSAVGAGGSSYAALQGGYNQNISNMPTQALPQLQPQQTMAA